jgi:Asp-tRNA(Asn)/Glu-tRNA(Gln) amidotransferase A subunit family amidase
MPTASNLVSKDSSRRPRYDAKTSLFKTFYDAVKDFENGSDTPRAYLERCLETIESREDEVMAFAFLNKDGARKMADRSAERYKARRPLSLVDGMPIGIKDLIATADMPTEYGSDYFRGNRPNFDAATVRALRHGGAVFVGKTETVCLGNGAPARTRNPFDLRRTPGGSSSGSAAAIAAQMLPVALGTHAKGSTIRPASFCGIYGLKATYGAINRQGQHSAAESTDHVGVLAGSLSDMWIAARFMAEEAGGDPGHPGLYGERFPPSPHKPARLIRIESAGWAETDGATKAAFEAYLSELDSAGIDISGRKDDPAIEEYERELVGMSKLWETIYRFEMRWPFQSYYDYNKELMSPPTRAFIESVAVNPSEYRAALAKRDYLRAMHDELARRVDGFVTLASPGPGPIGMDQGSAIFNEGSSTIGMPALSLPYLTVDNAPVGVQLQGRWHEDERLVAVARWLTEQQLGSAT